MAIFQWRALRTHADILLTMYRIFSVFWSTMQAFKRSEKYLKTNNKTLNSVLAEYKELLVNLCLIIPHIINQST